MVARVGMPIVVLGVGWLAYVSFAGQREEKIPPPQQEQTIRTEVVELRVQDYPVVVTTHGVVQPHDQVVLAAQVSGQIVGLHPSFDAGSYFLKGDILVELDSKNYEIALAMARADQLRAKSALQLAKLSEERFLRLDERNSVSRAELERASATREQAEAALASAEAQTQRAQLDLDRTEVSAPFAGRVRLRSVGIGQIVGPETPLGEVFAVDFAEVRLPIASHELPHLDLPEVEGDPPVAVELRDSISETSTTVWHAHIVRTEGMLDEDSRELFAIARVQDPFGRKSGHPPLRMGQPVVASIMGRLLTGVVPIPRVAVRQLDRINLIDESTYTLLPATIDPIWADQKNVIVRDPLISDKALISTTHLVFAPRGAKVEIVGGDEVHDVVVKTGSDGNEPVTN